MKNPFNSILKKESVKKATDPLSWMSTLSTLDGPSQLRLCIQHITRLLNDKQLSILEKIDAIFTIDEHNQAQIKRQMDSFARADNLKQSVSDNIISNHYAYERIMFLAYSKLIEKSFSQTDEAEPDSEKKKLLLVRTILIATKMLKWRYFDHNSAPTQLWLQTHRLYKVANQHQLADATVIPYADAQETSFKSVYLILQMLGAVNHNALLKSQIDCSEKLLHTFVLSIRVKHELEKYHSFYVDLDKDKAADRVRTRPPKGNNCLFWDLDEAEHLIDTAIEELTNNKAAPLLTGHGIRPRRTHLDTLLSLKKEWAKAGYVRQRRRVSRQANAKMVSATLSIEHIIPLIKQRQNIKETARGFLDGTLSDRRLSTSVVMRGNINTMVIGDEKWVIQDESNIGLGSVIKTSRNVRPNKLIAIHNENNDTKIAVGVIRNTKQLSGGKLKTGIEILSDKVLVTNIKKLDTKRTKSEPLDLEEKERLENQPFEVIYLAENLLTESPASLLVPKINFMPNSFYELNYKGQHEIIMLQEVLESGDDWLRLAFPEELD